MVDLVVDPLIVPSPAFELPRIAILDPADFASDTIDDLILKLRAAPRPQRLIANDERQRVYRLRRNGLDRLSAARRRSDARR
ncbi:MAG TPA: hypothetical protein VFI56_03505 [Vicinamibacterales bacterium]|nr:hypothetical protein [Vicinamibacterales bacterium]